MQAWPTWCLHSPAYPKKRTRSGMFTNAFALTNDSTILKWPFCAAYNNGVHMSCTIARKPFQVLKLLTEGAWGNDITTCGGKLWMNFILNVCHTYYGNWWENRELRVYTQRLCTSIIHAQRIHNWTITQGVWMVPYWYHVCLSVGSKLWRLC